MSGRRTVGDRMVVLLLGLALLGGAAAMVWWSRRAEPEALAAPFLEITRTAMTQWWWPPALLAAGAALVVVGLRWLLRGRRAIRATVLTLRPFRVAEGVLSADVGAVADGAAVALAEDPAIRRARAATSVEKRRATVTVTASVTTPRDLADAAGAADRTAATVAAMTGGRLAHRTVLRVDRRAASRRTP